MEELEIEVPKYFTCPISLQIMRDPVTTSTGITYDRDSIEKWLNDDTNTATCPVTNQPLLQSDDGGDDIAAVLLTPNHTLRRLIQGWCVASGVDRIPTPKPVLDRRRCLGLARGVRRGDLSVAPQIESLANESERNRKLLAEAGVLVALRDLVVRHWRTRSVGGVEDVLRALNQAWVPVQESGDLGEYLESLGWVLREGGLGVKAEAVKAVRVGVGSATGETLERLKLELFMSLTVALKEMRVAGVIGPSKAAMEAMMGACPWGRNRAKMVEAGAVSEAIETLLALPEKDRRKGAAEAAVVLIGELCRTAEGRAGVTGHAAGIAAVSRYLLRVSATTDEWAVRVLARVAGTTSARTDVLADMMAFGAVAKLCMVVQADCSAPTKDKAISLLKMHSKLWSHSPCVAQFLTSR